MISMRVQRRIVSDEKTTILDGTTLSRTTFGIAALSVAIQMRPSAKHYSAFSVIVSVAFCIVNWNVVMLNVTILRCYAECYYAECSNYVLLC